MPSEFQDAARGMLPALDNIQDFHAAMKILTCLKATDVEIATELFQCKTMSVMSVILCKLEALDIVVIKSVHGTTLQIRLLDLCCLCDGFDPSYYQVRQSKVAGVPCVNVAVVWPRIGPSSTCVNCEGVQAMLSPKNIGNVLLACGQVLDTDAKAKGSTDEKILDESGSSRKRPLHHSQIMLKAHDIAVIVKDVDNNDRGQISVSVDLSSDKWQHKTTYKGWIGIAGTFHGSEQVSRDPCFILGNEMISRPWTCSFTGSDVRGQCTIISVNSEDFLSLVLRPACVQAFSSIHKDFQLSLDQVQVQTTLMSFKACANKLSTTRQVFVELNGANVFFEMGVYEQVLGLSLDKLKVEFEQDLDHLAFELTLKDIEVEDNIHGITAFQFLRQNERNLLQMISFSVVRDLKSIEENVSFKHLKATVGDLSVCLEETLLLKLLQFCGVNHPDQLWGKEQIHNASDNGERDRSFSTLVNTSFFFDKVEVSSFVSVSTVTPAMELSDDLQTLKETLEIPQSLPPTVDKMRIQFGSFLRTGIRYKSTKAAVRDVRRHYLKEIGRQSGKVLGSLHILGNVSALKTVIGKGLAELQETGDYVGFAGHIKSGLADSYYKFADSWSASIKKNPNKSATDWEDVSTRDTSMERRESLVHSIAGNLASGIGSWIFRSSTEDTCQEIPQASSTPVGRSCSAALTRSPGGCNRRLITDTGDQESSGSEESSLSCPLSLEEWDLLPGFSVRKAKGQEFLRRLKLNLGDSPDETFHCCSRLRHLNPDEKLNALITSHGVYFLKGRSPDVDNVVLKVELNRLFKSQYKSEGGAHYLELLMRMSGVSRLCLPSPDPADSPLVQCDTAEIAHKAARKINEAKKSHEKANYRSSQN